MKANIVRARYNESINGHINARSFGNQLRDEFAVIRAKVCFVLNSNFWECERASQCFRIRLFVGLKTTGPQPMNVSWYRQRCDMRRNWPFCNILRAFCLLAPVQGLDYTQHDCENGKIRDWERRKLDFSKSAHWHQTLAPAFLFSSFLPVHDQLRHNSCAART